jgi:fused signal recognition particle receptor
VLKVLKEKLARTRNVLKGGASSLMERVRGLPEDFYEELEEMLIQADLGVEVTQEVISNLRKQKVKRDEVVPFLRKTFLEVLDKPLPPLLSGEPDVYLIVGVNGTGKTTTVAKLAYFFQRQGENPILVAADTFRAAAIEQLVIWGERLKAPVIKQERGADAASVVYDAVVSAQSGGNKLVIADTAGRIHTREDLMRELQKIKRVAQKASTSARVVTLLVLDATFGQNALSQASEFTQSLELDGVILTKLDGSAKGGSAIPIVKKLGIPIWFIGYGEKLEDFSLFSPQEFVDALLA